MYYSFTKWADISQLFYMPIICTWSKDVVKIQNMIFTYISQKTAPIWEICIHLHLPCVTPRGFSTGHQIWILINTTRVFNRDFPLNIKIWWSMMTPNMREIIFVTCTFRLTFQNESWYVSLEWYFIYLLFLASVHGFMYETSDFFTL